MKVENKTFIIPGGASGLGLGAAELLVQSGAKVVLLDRDDKRGNEVLSKLGKDKALFVKVDVTSEKDVRSAINLAVATFGDIHGVMNCAGIGIAKKILGKNGEVHPLDFFNLAIQVNLVGTFNVCRLVVERMATQMPVTPDGERGVIINVASVAAFDGQNGQVAYSASKGGVVSMTLPVARDLSSVGIRVVTVAPGSMDTPMIALANKKLMQSLIDQNAFPPRSGKPEEFGHLCKGIIENGYINGTTIRMDAGVRLPKL